MPLRRIFPFLLALTLLSATSSLRGSVTIKREPPVVEHKIFDPSHPPKAMPHLSGDEAAVTEAVFNCSLNTTYHVDEQIGGDGGCRSTIRIKAIQIDLQVHITIWLPIDAKEKLKAHEEGHRRITERIYKERAENAARAAATRADGKQFTGKGKDCDQAVNAAMGQADTLLCQSYLKETGGVAGRIGDLYDDLTRHGTNKLPEDQAIRQAFERYEKETADKSPAPPRESDRK